MRDALILGTRGSALALAQSGMVARAITERTGVPVELTVIRTRGDAVQDRPLPEVGGKGLFTAELESALRSGEIHLAVHSLKDLPVDDPEGLTLGAIPEREDPRDAVIGALPPGARVGTGSARRVAQLAAWRSDLRFEGIRGNIDTRARKVGAGFDAVILAMAGLNRLGLPVAPEPLDPAICLPAPGQGALAIQCRADDEATLALLARLDHAATRAAVAAERALLAALGGGCSVPVGALAIHEGTELWLRGARHDGATLRRAEARGSDPAALGRQVAALLA